MEQVVRFTLRGKFAHFRRFYTNSSSLTYPIPPPTVIRGIVGAALGLSRAEYPAVLADLRVAVRPRGQARTVFQGINALKVVNSTDRELRGLEPRTQIPTQFLLPRTLDDALGFEVVLLPGRQASAGELAAGLRAPVYPPTLGTAYCLGWIEDVQVIDARYHEQGTEERALYCGALYADAVAALSVVDGQRLSRDRYPIRLSAERRLEAARDLLVELSGTPIACQYRGAWLELGEERWGLIG
ncbi:CRISPR-associated protein Cas5 [Thermomicrobiaceae bacterium CFH 74404]|uniref:CRISPR-associated protein Cas5 n=1 Tax=Thermalbibacter longus TaxID=2951981 RepID=A0AA41WCP4_9BACT|nr:CRISPR-associated protein Cas5 [Thermalbibacter longus]MCM8747880.1 CRISPR-associated protein Cas5 [Thermalbibacter longus]